MATIFTMNNGSKLVSKSPKEDLLEILIEKIKESGRIITHEEFSKYPDALNPNDYAFYFGSFEKAMEEAYKKTDQYKQEELRRQEEMKSRRVARLGCTAKSSPTNEAISVKEA